MLKSTLAAAAVSLLFVVTACSDYTDKFDGSNGSLLIGQGGGVIRAPAGPIGGSSLTVPQGSIANGDAAFITASEGQVVSEPGWQEVGPATSWQPAEQTFNPSALMTVPFDPAQIPAGISDPSIRVKLQGAGGVIETLVPVSVDRNTGLATARVQHLGTAWVSVPVVDLNAISADVGNYLPLNIGDAYRFASTSGETVAMDVESGLSGDTSLTLAHPSVDVQRTVSLVYQQGNRIVSSGWIAPDHEMRFITPIERLPASPLFGETYSNTTNWVVNVSGNAIRTGRLNMRSQITRVPPAEAMMTTGFADVIQWATERKWFDDMGTLQIEDELDFVWLALDVGPVMYRDFDGKRFDLTGATVGGQLVR